MRIIAITLFAALAGSCAATPAEIARGEQQDARQQARLAEALDGYEIAGPPTSCVSQTALRGSRSFGNTILYDRGTRRTIYRNDTQPGCRISNNDILVTRSPTGNLCSGDIIRTIDRTAQFVTGGCAFGEFVPYERVARGRRG